MKWEWWFCWRCGIESSSILMHLKLNLSDAFTHSGVSRAPQGSQLLPHLVLSLPHLRALCSFSHWRNKGKFRLWKLSCVWCLKEIQVKEPDWQGTLMRGPAWVGTWAPSLAPSCFMPRAVSCPSSTFWVRFSVALLWQQLQPDELWHF